ncbi:MAG: CDP-alcohol phosphatidyltransferase family protein [Flavobacteriales bacterium]
MAKLPRLPDLLTTANLCCGGGSILLASQGQLTLACWLVFAGAFFDVLDGLAARALGGGSPLGAQLDSLADMVTFGVAPAFLMFQQGSLLAGNALIPEAFEHLPYPNSRNPLWPTLAASLIVVVASCWRLAKFNLDTRQTSGFLGLPTPSNGLFWVSVVMASQGIAVQVGPYRDMLVGVYRILIGGPYAMLALSLLLAVLMLSELPLPGLKFKHFKWRGNEVIYLLMGIVAVLVVLYGMLAVPLIMVLYVLSPLWGRVFGKAV